MRGLRALNAETVFSGAVPAAPRWPINKGSVAADAARVSFFAAASAVAGQVSGCAYAGAVNGAGRAEKPWGGRDGKKCTE